MKNLNKLMALSYDLDLTNHGKNELAYIVFSDVLLSSLLPKTEREVKWFITCTLKEDCGFIFTQEQRIELEEAIERHLNRVEMSE